MSNGRSTQRGAALIIVLMLVATLALGALALTETMKRAVNQSGAASARDQAVWALLGAETAALHLLKAQNQRRENIDTLDEPWLREPVVLATEQGTITGTFRDRSACFNLNQLAAAEGTNTFATDPAGVARFGILLDGLGGDRRTGQTLANAVADYMDTDDRPNPGGAEDFAYTLGVAPYVTARTHLHAVSEVRAVKLWTAPIFRALAPYLCVRPGNATFGLVNINTIDEDQAALVFAALEGRVSMNDITRLIANRPDTGYESVDMMTSARVFQSLDPPLGPEQLGRLATYASFIEFTAEVRYRGVMFEMTSMIAGRTGGEYEVVARRLGGRDL